MSQLILNEHKEEAEKCKLCDLANGEVFKHYGDLFVKLRMSMGGLADCLEVKDPTGRSVTLQRFLEDRNAEMSSKDHWLCLNLRCCSFKALHKNIEVTPTTTATLDWSTQVL